MHQQELALVASSLTSCVIQGCLLGSKTAPPQWEDRECYVQERESRAGVDFSQEFSASPLSPFAQNLLHSVIIWNTVMPVASSCFVEQEMPSWRSYLTSSVNGVLYNYGFCQFLLRGFVFTVRSDVRSAGMNLLCLKDTSMTLQFCRLFLLMQS